MHVCGAIYRLEFAVNAHNSMLPALILTKLYGTSLECPVSAMLLEAVGIGVGHCRVKAALASTHAFFANEPSGSVQEDAQPQISSFLADVCYSLLLNSLTPSSSSCLAQLSLCHLSQFFLQR